MSLKNYSITNNYKGETYEKSISRFWCFINECDGQC